MKEIRELKPRLIVGLGNNEKAYQNTYHNVGHMFVDYIETSSEAIKNDGYMNNAGLFVAKQVRKTGTKSEELLIAHDDSDIELGSYKFSFGSGSAGHRGAESIIQALKTKDFWRLRIGIRPPRNSFFSKLRSRQKAGSFVLKKISQKNKEVLKSAFEKAAHELSDTENG